MKLRALRTRLALLGEEAALEMEWLSLANLTCQDSSDGVGAALVYLGKVATDGDRIYGNS
jgi:hypothetical protein